ncbi:TetR/AcrR family transcriptional regulator C-terminal domain-containing protein [Streptomyces sp. SCA3-4]|uniref:TetR/AcrR family transcriptional regulator C-terminal domain-containing protein n=1 Tax=Streptomyces sichuanensis TaxID=2871810 RepID=UPI001CE2B272|nr:TetR/AcrR family transcriptional regulator C-terminal domain-containing protein [Streptomyces sichuanensis]MCA6093834.1 TetR/AcrR family transcriptional regulator C-terminal domain-containing protein [Streptomyces sichuanensis]
MAEKNSPPYLRIAAELRRRIADGDLAPGDRVPSTRQIAREWNVALATATKVLTTLRQEGLVRAQSRVGTVVAGPGPAVSPAQPPSPAQPQSSSPGRAADGELTQERIVRAAVAIADAEGLAALSMRGVAARLGVAAMSPYRHVTGKEDLVFLMADAVLAEMSYPRDAPPGWRGRLERGARALWAVHRAHPWLAQIAPLTRPLALPHLIAYSDWMLGALDGHGLDPATMFNLNALIYSYVQGTAVQLEREAQAQSATGMSEEQWMDSQAAAFDALVASGAYPAFTKVVGSFGDSGYDMDLDAVFELGLTSMLDGLAALIDD